MRLLPVALAVATLSLAGLAFAPGANATCMQVYHMTPIATCFVCPTAAATELACGIERDVNGYATCFLDTAPSQWLDACA